MIQRRVKHDDLSFGYTLTSNTKQHQQYVIFSYFVVPQPAESYIARDHEQVRRITLASHGDSCLVQYSYTKNSLIKI